MDRLGRGYSFEALRAKILFAEGAFKLEKKRPMGILEMLVYSTEKDLTSGHQTVLKHLGTSPDAAMRRIEGMFVHQREIGFEGDGQVRVFDSSKATFKKMSLRDLLSEFCSFVRLFTVAEYSLRSEQSLRLVDKWEDDPIGSAGPGVVDLNLISESDKAEIFTLFAPFRDVIYPFEIFNKLPKRHIKGLKNSYTKDPLFDQEFKKRKTRSLAIGEDFRHAQFQEVVWLDYTMRLRNWALSKGYDTFVYSNIKESDGRDTFVTLKENQISRTGRVFVFLENKYLQEMQSLMEPIISTNYFQLRGEIQHVLWGQRDPSPYWEIVAQG